jgi:hypothetical protein
MAGEKNTFTTPEIRVHSFTPACMSLPIVCHRVLHQKETRLAAGF